jgi:hypothetical protein
VDDIVNVWVLLEHLVDGGLVLDVELVELGSLSADEFDAVEDLLRGVVEAVDDDDLVVGLEKSKSCEGADVAGATASR